MDARTRLAAVVALIGRLLLLIDAYVAACLDRRPLDPRRRGRCGVAGARLARVRR